MQKITLLLLLGILAAPALQAQEVTIVTIVESSSLNRGRILVTGPEGRTERIDLKSIWGLGGVNLNNLAENDRIMQTLFEDLLRSGWRLDNVMPVPGDEGQLLTRYIYSRYPDEVPAAEQPKVPEPDGGG
jgi:hypothetical protein